MVSHLPTQTTPTSMGWLRWNLNAGEIFMLAQWLPQARSRIQTTESTTLPLLKQTLDPSHCCCTAAAACHLFRLPAAVQVKDILALLVQKEQRTAVECWASSHRGGPDFDSEKEPTPLESTTTTTRIHPSFDPLCYPVKLHVLP